MLLAYPLCHTQEGAWQQYETNDESRSRECVGVSISGATNSMVFILILDNFSVSTVCVVPLGRKLTGWNHFDVTRDELGNSKIYLNEELILEYKDEITISSDLIYFESTTIGPALDNVVVRNQVLEIQPVE